MFSDGFTNNNLRTKERRLSIVLELVRGGALDSLLYSRKWAPTGRQVVKMGMDIADAMSYLHGRKDERGKKTPIIHRDLKSPNLLLVEPPPPSAQSIGRGSIYDDDPEDGKDAEGWLPIVKITDFGLARQKETQIETMRTAKMQTQLMTGCGTLYWMAPELLNNEKYNESVDVYAFAVCLLEMASGEIPRKYDGKDVSPAMVASKVVDGFRPDFSVRRQVMLLPRIRIVLFMVRNAMGRANRRLAVC